MTKQFPMPKVNTSLTTLFGGLDTETPSLSLPAGYVRDGLNFEVAQNRGYSRIAGLERFSGQAAPSDATYTVVQVVAFTNTPSVGQTITQATSGATGQIIATVTGATPYMVVTKVTGTFDYTHAITTPGPVAVGTATTPTAMVSALQNAIYLNLAADVYRALIAAVPGSGAVLGVSMLVQSGVNTIYAWRANVGGTAVNIYKSSSSGWTLVALLNEISFTAGGAIIPADGATLTQGGVTATVRRVVQQSGSWSGSTAAGRFIITNPSGGAFAAGAATLTGGAGVTLSGASVAITILPGGKYEIVQGNFSGQLSTLRLYGADGVNRGFEFDGATYVPISTGAATDTPKHVTVHLDCLFFSLGSSILYSGPGTPFIFITTLGGGEIATGDTVTNLLEMPGSQQTGTLAVFCASTTFMLYGTDATTWALIQFNIGTGGIDYSAQGLEDAYFMGTEGVFNLQATLNFGNFTGTALTKNIMKFILTERSKVSNSAVFRSKSQFRMFFNDGYGLFMTINNGKYLGAIPVLFPVPVYCVVAGNDANNNEVSYYGGTNGFVYQLEKGTSFDGANIDAYVTLAWDAIKSPRIIKRFRRASIEMQGNAYAAINFSFSLEYGSTQIGTTLGASYVSGFQAAPFWDSFVWDNFVWDGQTLAPTTVGVDGSAENIQYTIASSTDYIAAYTINSVVTHFTSRRQMRN